jgi:phage head maturation protease
VSQPLEYRAVPIREADTDGRTMDILVAPKGEVADLGYFTERYADGALAPADRVALKLETGTGHSGPVIGRAVGFSETTEGLVGTFRVSDTEAGRDALTLATDGALGATAGFLESKRSVTDEGVEVVEAASLREVTLTGTPAYVTAGPLDIRSQTKGRNVEPITEAAEVVTEPVATEAVVTEAVNRALDTYRQGVAEAETPTQVEAEHRGHEYRDIGELMSDTILSYRGKSAEATERLTRSIDLGIVEADRTAINLDTRAFLLPGNSVGAAVAPTQYIPDLLELLREGRPTADLFASKPLPELGNNIDLPAVSVGNTVDYQDGQNTAVESTTQEQILTSFPKSTMAGGQGMSIQAIQWSQPAYLETVVSDLMAAYGEFLDGRTINGDPAVDTPTSATGYTGILDGATDVPVTGGVKAAMALVGTAWAAVYAGSRRSPIAAIMNSLQWGDFLNAVDADGRPIVSTEAPSNPAGFGNAASIAGTLRSVPVVLDDNLADGNVIFGSFRDANLYEAGVAQIGLTYPDVLTTDVTVFGFSALAIRRPAAFAVLSGITVDA